MMTNAPVKLPPRKATKKKSGRKTKLKVSQYVARYLAARDVTPMYAAMLRAHVRCFTGWAGDIRIAAVTCELVNEWLAAPAGRFDEGWIELANTESAPVALAGIRVSNNVAGDPNAYTFPPLSFLAAGGHLRLDATVGTGAGARTRAFLIRRVSACAAATI